ncbi:MAG: diadenylate cyclase [Acidobacteria bacterium]|nr:diadenylate cyclase [Acidobacteriota bacterium]
MTQLLLDIRWNDLLDMAMVAVLLWTAFIWLRRTRARMALVGLGILAVVYLVARRLELQITTWILQGFFAALVLVLVVVFQEDLRRLFEQIAVWGLRRRSPNPAPDTTDVLVRTVAHLARHKTGALVVLPGKVPLDRHLEGGIALDGLVSGPLLLSLFDTHSPGHDGAVILAGDRIRRYAVHLPLSNHHSEVGEGGTRHAAALGLAERTDALCVVVSEERGTVSVARDGNLRRLPQPEALSAEVRDFLERPTAAGGSAARAWGRVVHYWREALVAVAAAVLLWFGLVAGSGTGDRVIVVPVEVSNLPAGYRLDGVDPAQVQVTLDGPRNQMLLLDPKKDVRVELDALLVQLGRRTFQLTPDLVSHPRDLTVIAIEPATIKLSVSTPGGGTSASAATAPPPPGAGSSR